MGQVPGRVRMIDMKIAIRYYSRGGNTRKIADAISRAVGVEAKTLSEPLKAAADFASKIIS